MLQANNERKLDLHCSIQRNRRRCAAEQLKDIGWYPDCSEIRTAGVSKVSLPALKYARENDVPCMGICLGMQGAW